jgi:hypothetical protein
MGIGFLAHMRANLAAYSALFIALGGVSYAAVKVPANSVGTEQIKNGAVTQEKLEPAFFAKLSAPGPRGAAGAQGAKGEAGQPGAQGATGPQGTQGVSALSSTSLAPRKSFTATTNSGLAIQFGTAEFTLACPAASPQPCRITGAGAYLDGAGIPQTQPSSTPTFPTSIAANGTQVIGPSMTGAVVSNLAPGQHTLAIGFTQDQGQAVTVVGTPKFHLRAIVAPQG